MIAAPTGIGKTTMFYRLALQQRIKVILMLSYTSQVLQGKEKHTVPGVMEGLCGNDRTVPDAGSIFGTYDKASLINKSIDARDYDFTVIDEAHNLVNHYDFRNDAMKNLKSLCNQSKAVIYLTATPDYLNFRHVDLLIRISQNAETAKPGTVVKYQKDSKSALINAIINRHVPGMIDVIYTRSIKDMVEIQYTVSSKMQIESHLINTDAKGISPVYENLSKHQMLSANGVYENGGLLFTTNLIVDGVNICDKNIGDVYLADPKSTTDLVQFPARFRCGYSNYFIFISGNKSDAAQTLSRNELVQKYYQMALMQKKSYENVNKLYNALGGFNFVQNTGENEIKLINSYDLLDHDGNIVDETILLKAQELEAFRMRWDVDYLKDYLGNDQNGFLIDEKNISKPVMKKKEIKQSVTDLKIENSQRIDLLKALLQDDFVRDEFIKDYLKKKNPKSLNNLYERYGIRNHLITNKYNEYLCRKDCLKLLFKYCSGIDMSVTFLRTMPKTI